MHSATLFYCSTGAYSFIFFFYSSPTIYPFSFFSSYYSSSSPLALPFLPHSPLSLFLHFLYHLCFYYFKLLVYPSHIMTKSILGVRGVWILKFNVSLFYRTSFRTATDTQGNLVLEKRSLLRWEEKKFTVN